MSSSTWNFGDNEYIFCDIGSNRQPPYPAVQFKGYKFEARCVMQLCNVGIHKVPETPCIMLNNSRVTWPLEVNPFQNELNTTFDAIPFDERKSRSVFLNVIPIVLMQVDINPRPHMGVGVDVTSQGIFLCSCAVRYIFDAREMIFAIAVF